jgi:hypothetical protein
MNDFQKAKSNKYGRMILCFSALILIISILITVYPYKEAEIIDFFSAPKYRTLNQLKKDFEKAKISTVSIKKQTYLMGEIIKEENNIISENVNGNSYTILYNKDNNKYAINEAFYDAGKYYCIGRYYDGFMAENTIIDFYKNTFHYNLNNPNIDVIDGFVSSTMSHDEYILNTYATPKKNLIEKYCFADVKQSDGSKLKFTIYTMDTNDTNAMNRKLIAVTRLSKDILYVIEFRTYTIDEVHDIANNLSEYLSLTFFKLDTTN